jgi:hypothetical protein
VSPDEFLSLAEGSASLKTWFDSLQDAGFTESQAIAIIVGFLSSVTPGVESV